MSQFDYTALMGKTGATPLGQPFLSTYRQGNALNREKLTYDAVCQGEQHYLGFLKLTNDLMERKTPLLADLELGNNTIYAKPGDTLLWDVAFLKGAAFVLDNLCPDNNTPGKGQRPFFLLMSENMATNGDYLTPNKMSLEQVRVMTIEEAGDDARIIPYETGYRMLVVPVGDAKTYINPVYLSSGTRWMKVYSDNGGGSENILSSLTGLGSDRHNMGIQRYMKRVPESKMAIGAWIDSDSSRKTLKVSKAVGGLNPSNLPQHLKEGSQVIYEFFSKEKNGSITPRFWISKFRLELMAELMYMQEMRNVWGVGHVLKNARGETRTVGDGLIAQIKKYGNYQKYSTFRDLLTRVMNAAESLFNINHMVKPRDRQIKVRCSRGPYQELIKEAKARFKNDSGFVIEADHPEILKAKMIEYSEKYGLMYTPIKIEQFYDPGVGRFHFEHDETLDFIDDDLESVQYYGTSDRRGIVFIEDICDGNFTNTSSFSTMMKGNGKGNAKLIKDPDYKPITEFFLGSDFNEEAARTLGYFGSMQNISSLDKGMLIRMATHGYLHIQDPTRYFLLEYENTATIY